MKFNRKHYGMKRRSSGGQAILEYIIIIALVTVTALTVLGLFGDRIRGLISSSTKAIGGETDDSNKSGLEQMRETGNGEDPINF
jgi:Flp pilus assembly pilin Flp